MAMLVVSSAEFMASMAAFSDKGVSWRPGRWEFASMVETQGSSARKRCGAWAVKKTLDPVIDERLFRHSTHGVTL